MFTAFIVLVFCAGAFAAGALFGKRNKALVDAADAAYKRGVALGEAKLKG